jgi:hypothetical protein
MSMPCVRLAPDLASLALAVLALIAPCASAATWQPVRTTDPIDLAIDVDSVDGKNGQVTAWIREVHPKRVPVESGAFFYRSTKSQMRFDCKGRTSTVLVRGYFRDDGSEIEVNRTASEPAVLFPDSAGEQLHRTACRLGTAAPAAAARATAPPPAPAAKPVTPSAAPPTATTKDGETRPTSRSNAADKAPVSNAKKGKADDPDKGGKRAGDAPRKARLEDPSRPPRNTATDVLNPVDYPRSPTRI